MIKIFGVFLFSLFAGSLYATIIVTEVIEQVYVNTPRSYDIDNDGDNDFSFTAVDPTPSTNSASYYVNSLKPTSYYVAESSGGERPKAFNANSGLGLHLFVSDTGLLASPTDGNFRNATKYLSVKFSDGTNTYFGWFQLEKQGFNPLRILAYGYSNVANDSIAPGETEPTGLQEVNAATFNLIMLTKNNIAFENCAAYDKVQVYTVDGKVIAQIENPIAFRNYALNGTSNQLLVAFFRQEKLLYTSKRVLN